jgi:hypothetical protein
MAKDVEVHALGDVLQRSRQVGVTLVHRLVAAPDGPEAVRPERREVDAEIGRAVFPAQGDRVPVMAKVAQVEAGGAVLLEPDETLHGRREPRCAMRREPHHLVLVSVPVEAEVLRSRG